MSRSSTNWQVRSVPTSCGLPPSPKPPEMRGIAGRHQQADGDTLIHPMSDRIAHRGPDDHGLFRFQEIGSANSPIGDSRSSI